MILTLGLQAAQSRSYLLCIYLGPWGHSDLNLQSTQNHGPNTLDFGIEAIVLATLEVQVQVKVIKFQNRRYLYPKPYLRFLL